MTKLLSAAVVFALVAGFSGVAQARNDNANGNANGRGNGNGNQGCVLLADGSFHGNPGQMFRHVREISGQRGFEPHQNPVQWLDNFPHFEGTVGDLIHRNCQELDPAVAP